MNKEVKKESRVVWHTSKEKPEGDGLILIEPNSQWGYFVGFYDDSDGDWNVYSPSEGEGVMVFMHDNDVRRWAYLKKCVTNLVYF